MPVGLSAEEALKRARDLRSRISEGTRLSPPLDDDLPDTLFGLCSLLEDDALQSTGAPLSEIQSVYQLVESLSWFGDEFDERAQMLARLSYLAWRVCLTSRPYGEVKTWRDRCVGHALSQDPVRDFLSIPFSKRSARLNWRFLADPAVLLAMCTLFERRRNTAVQEVALDGVAAWDWLSHRLVACPPVDMRFLRGDLCLSVGNALKYVSALSESEAWIERARSEFAQMPHSRVHLARAALLKLSVLHERHDSETILAEIPPLLDVFREENASFEYQTAKLLEALSHKNSGRTGEALRLLSALADSDAVITHPIAHCLALINLAELLATEGSLAAAALCFERADTRVHELNVSLCTGHFYGSFAECLRDQGRLSEAIDSYRLAVATEERGGLVRGAAYMRVILAETLVAAGREAEALTELVTALPVIMAEKQSREGAAAIALLSESIRRQRLDAVTIRHLRDQLQAMRDGGDS